MARLWNFDLHKVLPKALWGMKYRYPIVGASEALLMRRWTTKFDLEVYVARFVTSSEQCFSIWWGRGEEKEQHSIWGVFNQMCDVGQVTAPIQVSVDLSVKEETGFHKSFKIEDCGRRRHDLGTCRARDFSNCILLKSCLKVINSCLYLLPRPSYFLFPSYLCSLGLFL